MAGPGPAAGANGQVFIVSAARTPIGKFGGALADTPATTLGGVGRQAELACGRDGGSDSAPEL